MYTKGAQKPVKSHGKFFQMLISDVKAKVFKFEDPKKFSYNLKLQKNESMTSKGHCILDVIYLKNKKNTV